MYLLYTYPHSHIETLYLSVLSAGGPAIYAASLLVFTVDYLVGYPILAAADLAQLTGY
jgi:hypothetical protein